MKIEIRKIHTDDTGQKVGMRIVSAIALARDVLKPHPTGTTSLEIWVDHGKDSVKEVIPFAILPRHNHN